MADLRLRSIHAIQRKTPKGKIETIAPNTLFNALDEGQYKELTSEPNPAARAAPVETAADDEQEKTVAQMNKAELLAYAEANEIEVDASAKVAEIRAAIEAAESGEPAGEQGSGGEPAGEQGSGGEDDLV